MKKDAVREIDTEEFAWKLAQLLFEDFLPFLSPDYAERAQKAIADRMLSRVRQLDVGLNLNPFEFKCQYQLAGLLKRFTFEQDILSPQDVYELSVKKFMDNQERLSSWDYSQLPALTQRVVFSARGWIGSVLGDFKSHKPLALATFGKKSSVGVPMRKACESSRYEALTGSPEQILWFEHVYSVFNRPAHLYASRRAANRKVPLYREVHELEATLVPKKFDSLRMIVPNTTIGSLQSCGLGRVLEERLRIAGYDIGVLQPRHGELARLGSVDGSVTTADQRLASDNITTTLVEILFEPRWASALMEGRIGKLKVDGKTIDTPTFSTMGNGLTFPLQTLVFLGLLYGVKDVLGLKDPTISVFGDDMIYSTEMHSTVVDVFSSLGLVINEDKTFSEGDFRESCGSDYYRGIDVRPAFISQPDHRVLRSKKAEAYLYTVFNALTRRWGWDEIPTTLSYVRDTLTGIRPEGPLAVPMDFPDTSGVRVSLKSFWNHDGLQMPTTKSGFFRFRYLAFKPERTIERRQWPVYHRRLMSGSTHLFENNLLSIEGIKLLWSSGKYGLRRNGMILDDKLPAFEYVDERVFMDGGFSFALEEKFSAKRPGRGATMAPTIPAMELGRYRVATGTTSLW